MSPFSESYYKNLLDGLDAAEVKASDVNADMRVDSEYFQKAFLENAARLHNCKPVAEFCASRKLRRVKNLELTKQFNYLEISRVNIADGDYATVPVLPDGIPDRADVILKNGDVAVSLVRPNRNAAALIRNAKRTVCSSGFLILRSANIAPGYLFAYCKTRYFRIALTRESRATMYPAVSKSDALKALIFNASADFQRQIADVVKRSSDCLRRSESEMQAASDMLLSELGLDKWRADDGGVSVKRLGDVSAANRWDAEYYLPKYDCLLKTIKSYPHGWDSLANCRLAVLKEEMFSPANDSNYQYIELADVGNYGNITGCTKKSGENLPDRARRRVNAGDVIVSSVEGSLSSIALIDKNYHMSLCSTGFHVVAPRTLNAETLLVLFKSIIGQMQLRRGCSGTILTAINGDHLNAIILPMVRSSVQDKIRDKISAAYRQRNDSILLLQTAKAAVETAIEKGEKAAMRQLTQNALPPNSETN